MRDIKGLLLDIAGVLYEGERPVPGAVAAVEALSARYPIRFITNTTRKSRDAVLQKLTGMGFAVERDSVYTALDAAANFLDKKGARGYFLVYEPVEKLFGAYMGGKPDYVVVADAYTDFTYEKLNRGFRHLMEGAELVAIAKNRYFKDSDGALSLDAGGFVALLEFAAQKKAEILGKPSENFFRLACASMGLEPKEVLMVGDDIESDVEGAQRAGMRACQVKTGKFRPEDLEGSIVPDCLLDSIADLPALLER
ncbi:TIGR01458 family HAD-type hydrolase [Hydrogenimonas sp.]